MPFKSKKQQRYLYSQKPEIAKEFSKEMSPKDFKKLPEKASKSNRVKKNSKAKAGKKSNKNNRKKKRA